MSENKRYGIRDASKNHDDGQNDDNDEADDDENCEFIDAPLLNDR